MKLIINPKIYLPLIYILFGLFGYLILKKINDKINKKIVVNSSFSSKRKNTIISLINNIIKYLIAIIVVLSILDLYGVDTTSILASLGIIAVIIGLAFQDIVKDMLSGISIIFENLYAVGDTVKINDLTGEVISLGIRTTKIKSSSGEVQSISNSAITFVINYSIYDTVIYLDIKVNYGISLLERILNEIKEEIKNEDGVKGELKLLGIDSLNDFNFTYKVSLECKYNNSFAIKRKILSLVKEKFEKNNIELMTNKLNVNVRKD